jgi:hypothetical protein
MRELKNPEFLPTIELSPFDFKKKNWKVSQSNEESEKVSFALKCLKDSGIEDMFLIPETYHLYSINGISNQNLNIILKKHFNRNNLKYSFREWKDRLGAFLGGLVILEDDIIYESPDCCCDLADINYWIKISENVNNDWQIIQLGHPEFWLNYRLNGNKIEFSDCETQPRFSIEIKKFEKLMKSVQAELLRFEIQISEVLKQTLNRDDYLEISSRLVRGFYLGEK